MSVSPIAIVRVASSNALVARAIAVRERAARWRRPPRSSSHVDLAAGSVPDIQLEAVDIGEMPESELERQGRLRDLTGVGTQQPQLPMTRRPTRLALLLVQSAREPRLNPTPGSRGHGSRV